MLDDVGEDERQRLTAAAIYAFRILLAMLIAPKRSKR
jgi:hypothetical protein